MAKKAQSAELAAKAKFVFEGTVQQEKATSMKAVPASDRTVVVRVDRIIQSPDAFTDFAGQDVTVLLGNKEAAVKSGQSFVFYTNGWIFGDGLAVRSEGHEKGTPTARAAVTAHPGDPVRSLNARNAMAQAANAALIVTGRVSAVRLPAEATAKPRAAVSGTRGATPSEPISEHAPIWREAVIDIDEVHRGAHKAKQVVVRFPSSNDVRWYKAPKFHAGQEGVFLLHTNQLPTTTSKTELAGARGFAAAKGGPDEYTALDPADVQPIDELPMIMAATKSEGS